MFSTRTNDSLLPSSDRNTHSEVLPEQLNVLVTQQVDSHLEVEDAGVLVVEALTVRNDAMQQTLVQSQRADGGEQPAVTWKTDARMTS